MAYSNPHAGFDQKNYQIEQGKGDKNFLPYENFVGVSIGNGQYLTDNIVSKVNNGQITKYPYVLDDEFHVSTTHSQYYQLDLTADDDNDGESDIVVWYCLNSVEKETNDWFGRVRANIDTSVTNMYNISPRDIRNNYYIYNKGKQKNQYNKKKTNLKPKLKKFIKSQ